MWLRRAWLQEEPSCCGPTAEWQTPVCPAQCVQHSTDVHRQTFSTSTDVDAAAKHPKLPPLKESRVEREGAWRVTWARCKGKVGGEEKGREGGDGRWWRSSAGPWSSALYSTNTTHPVTLYLRRWASGEDSKKSRRGASSLCLSFLPLGLPQSSPLIEILSFRKYLVVWINLGLKKNSSLCSKPLKIMTSDLMNYFLFCQCSETRTMVLTSCCQNLTSKHLGQNSIFHQNIIN